MAPLLKQHGKVLTWFRYPYLHSGMTAEVHDTIVDLPRSTTAIGSRR